MPTATGVMTINLSAEVAGVPDTWNVTVRVMLSDQENVSHPAPEGSVKVELFEFVPATSAKVLKATADVDADGRVTFLGVEGVYYTGIAWVRKIYDVKATHKDTGVSFTEDLILDTQIPPLGLLYGWWAPFPYSEDERTYEF